MLIKTLIFFFLIINLNIPITNLSDLLLIGLIIALFFSIKKNIKFENIFLERKKIIFFILSIMIINFLIPKLQIEESHSVFMNYKDIKKISEIIPDNIIQEIKSNYNKFDFDRLSQKHDITKENFLETAYINSPYAFSSDSFFQNQKFTRINNKINFKSREDLRIGQINSIKYNFPHDKEFRRMLPYYVLFEIPRFAQGSEVCTKGNFFYHFFKDTSNSNQIKDLNFIKKEDGCVKFSKSYDKFYLFGYSINKKDDLRAELKENYTINIFNLISLILKLILILLIFNLFFKIKISNNAIIYIVSFFSTVLICFLKDFNLITGLRYFRGGADGLLYFSLGRDIIENITNENYLLAIRGGADVFYFMPGQRYFVALSNIVFGDTSYGYLLLTSLLPLTIYIFLKKYLNVKHAQILVFLFIFFPIFENLGFGYFNYIHQATRNHSETLSILLILISFIYIFNLINSNNVKEKVIDFFFIGLILAFAAILRPNFFFTTSIISFFIPLILFNKKKYINIFSFLIGYSFFLVCLLHNIYFGSEFHLFSNAFNSKNFPLNFEIIKLAFYNLVIFNFDDSNIQKIIEHFFWWNPIYNIHRILILFYIGYSVYKFRQSLFTYILILCVFFQHSFLFISDPSSRYAYLAWLLTFIIFLKLIYDQKLILKLKSIKRHLFI